MHRSLRSGVFAAGLALFLSGPAHAAGDAGPLAMLVAAKGKVAVTSAGATQAERAALGRPLKRGDRVQVDAASSATLFFNDGNLLELGEKSSLVIAGKTPGKAGAAAAVSPDVFKTVSQSVVAGSRETGLVALGPMRGGNDAPTPLLLAPRRTDLLEDKPAFRWHAMPGATRYRVTVSGDAGALWSRETPDTTLAYPADAAALARDADLLWEVVALSDAGPGRREESTFRVVPAERAGQIQSQLAKLHDAAGGANRESALFVSGTWFAANGLYQDALEQFAELARLQPGAPEVHEALGNVYRAMGLTDLTVDEFQKALTLTHQP